MQITSIIVAASFAALAAAQAKVYAQCGGVQYTGPKNCVSTAKCVYINAYYSQCYPNPTK